MWRNWKSLLGDCMHQAELISFFTRLFMILNLVFSLANQVCTNRWFQQVECQWMSVQLCIQPHIGHHPIKYDQRETSQLIAPAINIAVLTSKKDNPSNNRQINRTNMSKFCGGPLLLSVAHHKVTIHMHNYCSRPSGQASFVGENIQTASITAWGCSIIQAMARLLVAWHSKV